MGAFHGNLLALRLQLQDTQGSSVGGIVEGVGPGETLDVSAGNGGALLVLEAIDLAEDRAFPQFLQGGGEVCLGLFEIGGALFGIGTVLGTLLIDLVAEVIKLAFGIAGGIHHIGGIERGDDVAFFDGRAIGNQMGQGHAAVVSIDLRDEDFGRVHSLDASGDPDLAFEAAGSGSRTGRRSISCGRGRASAGGQRENDQNGSELEMAHTTPQIWGSMIGRHSDLNG